ncbi:hypothetical protein BST13_36960 [Mycobacterium aquaticum]|uniref:Uncharacterized protein n=1 Tax=Mycobacterium aquaticum TaxID=1927124 RepID=A0A1W9ZVI9_9MYCO|nr:hypothetical protein BST13_36960 [Mycobacterium aquaticum]
MHLAPGLTAGSAIRNYPQFPQVYPQAGICAGPEQPGLAVHMLINNVDNPVFVWLSINSPPAFERMIRCAAGSS